MMGNDVILVALSAGLATLGAAVSWLVLRVIENSRDVAVLQSQWREADVQGSLREVHGRITELSECTHKILGAVEVMNERSARIEDTLMSKRMGAE